MLDDHDESEAIEAQQLLVESSLPLIFQMYDDALADGVVDPVVILLDCEDELGGAIARDWLGDEAVDDSIAAQHADESDDVDTTVCAAGLPLADVRGELLEAFPYLEPILLTPPLDEGVLVISVTAGGASALTAPDSAR